MPARGGPCRGRHSEQMGRRKRRVRELAKSPQSNPQVDRFSLLLAPARVKQRELRRLPEKPSDVGGGDVNPTKSSPV